MLANGYGCRIDAVLGEHQRRPFGQRRVADEAGLRPRTLPLRRCMGGNELAILGMPLDIAADERAERYDP
jgi:hypothetical protein